MNKRKYNYMFQIISLIIGVVCFSVDLSAQVQQRYILGQSSASANYVFCFGFPQMSNVDSTVMRHTKHFVVTRMEMLSDTTKKQKNQEIFVVKPIETAKELKRKLSQNFLSEFSAALGATNDEEVLKYFSENRMPEDYAFFYPFMETKIALGHVLKDDKIKIGATYIYIIKRLDTNGTEEEWGYCVLKGGVGNYTLDQLKAKTIETKAYDSTVIFRWYLDVSENARNSLIKPKMDSEYEQTLIEVLPYLAPGLRASLFQYKNGKYVQTETVLGQLNEQGDSLYFRFDLLTEPNNIEAAFIRLEDEIGNQGIPSDTAFAYAVTQRFIPKLEGIDITEIEDGIKISWKAMPPMPFVKGVLVYRFDSEDQSDTLGFFGLQDTFVIDYKIKVGQTYRYKAKALYADGVTAEQEIPAEGTGEYSIFSKPGIPTNLTAKSSNGNVLLKWDHASTQSLYGFYIYRGTKPDEVGLIAGPIKETAFLDTSDALSGRSKYFYRVVAQNLRQDTSEFSDYTEINPSRAIAMRAPETMEFYYENGKLHISWIDVRIEDNAIQGYQLQRKSNNSANNESVQEEAMPGDRLPEFVNIGDSIILTNNYIDTTFIEGKEMHYRLASVSFRGEIGEFSESSKFINVVSKSEIVDDFDIRNTEQGLLVSLPKLETDERAGFVLYKRKSTESEFVKLAILKEGIYEYLDKNVKDEELYVYGVTLIFKDGKEGEMGFIKSLRRSLK